MYRVSHHQSSSSGSGSLSATLRSCAQEGSAPSIQRAAGAMMKLYNTAAVAVTEWRNVLMMTHQPAALLSLLYVANEVLQLSKRNRGPKFLEAFSGVLGQALIYMCRTAQQIPHNSIDVTAKVRRTVKIWGDRRIFSVRFVQELLQGLEPYRSSNEGGGGAATMVGRATAPAPAPALPYPPRSLPPPPTTDPEDQPRFSPSPSKPPAAASTTTDDSSHSQQATTPATTTEEEIEILDDGDDEEEDDLMEMLERSEKEKQRQQGEGDDDDDDDDAIFGKEDGTKLQVDIDWDAAAATTNKRRVSTGSGSGGTSNKKRRRKRGSGSTGTPGASGGDDGPPGGATSGGLSATNLLELWTRVSTLQHDLDDSVRSLEKMEKLLDRVTEASLEDMVGDELQQTYRQGLHYQEQIQTERRNLHRIATERKMLEQQAVAYVPWLERAVRHDDDDLVFCDRLTKELQAFLPIHSQIYTARQLRRQEEQQRLQMEAEQERKRKEREETERFRKEAMKKQTEGGAGMVWNPTTREYQTLATDEEWRD